MYSLHLTFMYKFYIYCHNHFIRQLLYYGLTNYNIPYILRSWVNFPFYTLIHKRAPTQFLYNMGFVWIFLRFLRTNDIVQFLIFMNLIMLLLLNNLYKVDKTNTTHISSQFLHIGRETERISIDDFCTLIRVLCDHLITYKYLQAVSGAGLESGLQLTFTSALETGRLPGTI